MKKPKGKYKCQVCGKVCDGSELRLNKNIFLCSDYFCEGYVVKVVSNNEYRIMKILEKS